MTMNNPVNPLPNSQIDKFNYTLQHADNCLILGQRLGEWCGHGPILEQDIAMTNISLDLIGQARMLYQYATELQGAGKSEDDLAYLRDGWTFKNILLVEQPNGDFAKTIMRQFLFDSFNCYFYEELMNRDDDRLVAIAEKSHKEAVYHLKWSEDWVLRLGDGTEESHKKIDHALTDLWSYSREPVIPSITDKKAMEDGFGANLENIKTKRDAKIQVILEEATLTIPESAYNHQGGKEGRHTEYLGYILTDLQFLQRAYPGNEW